MKNLEHKSFAMSMFASQKDLFEAKAAHYENEAEALQMTLTLEREKTATLERHVFELAQRLDNLTSQF